MCFVILSLSIWSILFYDFIFIILIILDCKSLWIKASAKWLNVILIDLYLDVC